MKDIWGELTEVFWDINCKIDEWFIFFNTGGEDRKVWIFFLKGERSAYISVSAEDGAEC